ncbi:orotate phosphoribosyltransferase [Helicobacter sp. MIT 14-3879]|uniref:orotate phosphoribosyltransferase n=1 Tax=Helicobacter sp. MIT 14-3879 TaxID=2040649 RepID=UPI000E1F94F7|nr:orotate phosphoribosyltransferase [Helicobacter sp. MIT 14-3879]RDU63969.1 orotate phosphoribosyltransferase [Helicobacter sp. MIT 14-3879]
MDIRKYYIESNALLEGHFLLSSGNHSKYYLQSAKILEDPKVAEILAKELAKEISKSNIKIDCICSPAIGGILAGYELARALQVRFIFTERVNGVMNLRRGFNVSPNERILICEDIITTGGSAVESAECVKNFGAKVVAFAALANRGFCKRVGSSITSKTECKLPLDIPLFALDDFLFDMYKENECPMCRNGSIAIKPGSRGN